MTIGEFTVFDLMKKYKIGFAYALNVAERLNSIGYVKKINASRYSMIQTESSISEYISSHLEELRPNEYIEFGIKDNGQATLKSKFTLGSQYYSAFFTSLFLRILFSIPGAVFFLFVMYVLSHSTVNGHPISFGEYLCLCFYSYVILGIPANVVIRIVQAHIYHMRFTDFITLPRNWFFKQIKNDYEINLLLDPHKKFFIPLHSSTMQRLDKELNVKRDLALHFANIANTTLDENEFHAAINSCIKTLEWMAQFEKYNVFYESTPTNDIQKIKCGMQASIGRLHHRIDGLTLCSTGNADIDTMDGHAFEFYCADLLKGNGFSNVEVTQGSGDHGIDILAEKYDISYAIQCKCYSSNVGNAAVQQAHTGKSLYHKDVAVVLTNQYFTQQAKEEANTLGVKLWDRDKLQEMIKIANN